MQSLIQHLLCSGIDADILLPIHFRMIFQLALDDTHSTARSSIPALHSPFDTSRRTHTPASPRGPFKEAFRNQIHNIDTLTHALLHEDRAELREGA